MNCGMCGKPVSATNARNAAKGGYEPLCRPCSQSWRAHLAYQRELQQSYEDAREARIEQNHREWEEWREQQREKRQQERDEWWENYGLPRRLELIQARYGRN